MPLWLLDRVLSLYGEVYRTIKNKKKSAIHLDLAPTSLSKSGKKNKRQDERNRLKKLTSPPLSAFPFISLWFSILVALRTSSFSLFP